MECYILVPRNNIKKKKKAKNKFRLFKYLLPLILNYLHSVTTLLIGISCLILTGDYYKGTNEGEKKQF